MGRPCASTISEGSSEAIRASRRDYPDTGVARASAGQAKHGAGPRRPIGSFRQLERQLFDCHREVHRDFDLVIRHQKIVNLAQQLEAFPYRVNVHNYVLNAFAIHRLYLLIDTFYRYGAKPHMNEAERLVDFGSDTMINYLSIR
jgi:hypothetical protein